MDQIISLSAEIMTGNNVTRSNRARSFHGTSTSFLESLEICLKSEIGTEYFYRYLQQNHCEELAIYLQLLQKFKVQTTDKQRYVVVKEIINTCVSPKGLYAVNISYETRKKVELLLYLQMTNKTNLK